MAGQPPVMMASPPRELEVSSLLLPTDTNPVVVTMTVAEHKPTVFPIHPLLAAHSAFRHEPALLAYILSGIPNPPPPETVYALISVVNYFTLSRTETDDEVLAEAARLRALIVDAVKRYQIAIEEAQSYLEPLSPSRISPTHMTRAGTPSRSPPGLRERLLRNLLEGGSPINDEVESRKIAGDQDANNQPVSPPLPPRPPMRRSRRVTFQGLGLSVGEGEGQGSVQEALPAYTTPPPTPDLLPSFLPAIKEEEEDGNASHSPRPDADRELVGDMTLLMSAAFGMLERALAQNRAARELMTAQLRAIHDRLEALDIEDGSDDELGDADVFGQNEASGKRRRL